MPETAAEQKPERIYVANVRIWTPGRDGKGDEEVWSGYVHARKAAHEGRIITEYQQWKAINYARQLGGFVPSPGAWYQSRQRLQKENPEVENDFVTCGLEDTSTVIRILNRRRTYADGLVIQYPVVNANVTDFERDKKGVPKARQIWQMAMPLTDSYVNELPEEFDLFLNTIYGMHDARKQLPEYASVRMVSHENERRVLRGDWYWLRSKYVRVDVGGSWGTAGRYSTLRFRVFEGGEETIKEIDARKKQMIIEGHGIEEADDL